VQDLAIVWVGLGQEPSCEYRYMHQNASDCVGMHVNASKRRRINANQCMCIRLHAPACVCMRSIATASTLAIVEVHVCPVTLVRCPALLLHRLRVVDVEVLHASHQASGAVRDVHSRLQPFPEEAHGHQL